MTDTTKQEITPDQLMDTFHGSRMRSIILFTVVVHAILILGGSVPYLWKLVAGEDTSKLGEKERMEIAVREATNSLREIAGKHGVKAEDLSSRFAGKAPVAAAKEEEPAEQRTAGAAEEGNTSDEGEARKSSIEKELETTAPGPEVPSFDDEKEDLFK